MELEVLESHGSLLQTVGKKKTIWPMREDAAPTARSLRVDGGRRGEEMAFTAGKIMLQRTAVTLETLQSQKVFFLSILGVFFCSKSNNEAFECRSRLPCKHCSGRHRVFICASYVPDAKESQQQQSQPQQSHQ